MFSNSPTGGRYLIGADYLPKSSSSSPSSGFRCPSSQAAEDFTSLKYENDLRCSESRPMIEFN